MWLCLNVSKKLIYVCILKTAELRCFSVEVYRLVNLLRSNAQTFTTFPFSSGPSGHSYT